MGVSIGVGDDGTSLGGHVEALAPTIASRSNSPHAFEMGSPRETKDEAKDLAAAESTGAPPKLRA